MRRAKRFILGKRTYVLSISWFEKRDPFFQYLDSDNFHYAHIFAIMYTTPIKDRTGMDASFQLVIPGVLINLAWKLSERN